MVKASIFFAVMKSKLVIGTGEVKKEETTNRRDYTRTSPGEGYLNHDGVRIEYQ